MLCWCQSKCAVLAKTCDYITSLAAANESLSASVDDFDASAADIDELRQQYSLLQAENQLLWAKVHSNGIEPPCIQTSAIVLDEWANGVHVSCVVCQGYVLFSSLTTAFLHCCCWNVKGDWSLNTLVFFVLNYNYYANISLLRVPDSLLCASEDIGLCAWSVLVLPKIFCTGSCTWVAAVWHVCSCC